MRLVRHTFKQNLGKVYRVGCMAPQNHICEDQYDAAVEDDREKVNNKKESNWFSRKTMRHKKKQLVGTSDLYPREKDLLHRFDVQKRYSSCTHSACVARLSSETRMRCSKMYTAEELQHRLFQESC